MNLPQEGTTQHVTFVLLLDIPSVTGFVNKCCGKKRVSSLTLYATFMKQTLLDIRNLNKNIIYTSVNKKKNTWKLFLILSLSSTGQRICDIVT